MTANEKMAEIIRKHICGRCEPKDCKRKNEPDCTIYEALTAYEAEKEHPDDKLSREAGMAMKIELEGKYTRVITERLEEYIRQNIQTAMKSHGAGCSQDVEDYAVQMWIEKLTGKDDHEN